MPKDALALRQTRHPSEAAIQAALMWYHCLETCSEPDRTEVNFAVTHSYSIDCTSSKCSKVL